MAAAGTAHLFPSHIAAVLLLAVLRAPPTTVGNIIVQDQPPPWLACDPNPRGGSYAENSTYHANINRLSATLPKNTSSSPVLYATGSVGEVPDIVYGLALCRFDADAPACEACVAAAFRGAQQGCPLTRDVLVFYDLCQLRFSNRDFLVDDDYYVTTYTLQRSERVAMAAAPFDAAVRALANATANYTTENSSRRLGTGEEGFARSSARIYALSQCTPDKTPEVCRACLSTLVMQLPALFSGRTGAGIFGLWCSFRYELYPFFSGQPLLRLPAFVDEVGTPLPPPPTKGGDKKRNMIGIILAIAMPIISMIVAMTIIYYYYWKKRRSATQPILPYDIESINSLVLDLSMLRVATNGFNEGNVLGKGGFGMVYKGVLPGGEEIAVKRLSQSSSQGIREMKSELVLVAKLHHRNLVRLIGVCLEEREKIIVYEYMPNRSLDTILFDSVRNKDLDWEKRFKIINGIARGLQYLHEDSQLKIVHRDLKANNILLDSDYNPKISDFGLAKIFGGDQSQDVTRRIAGTYGYMAPEYAIRGQYSIKSDVFSFGVLVLEMITGRRNNGSYDIEQYITLLSLVWEHWTRGNVIELIDPSLSNHPPIDQMVRCIHVALLCVQKTPESRPTMSSVNVMFGSHTVPLPAPSIPAFCTQGASAHDRSNVNLEPHQRTRALVNTHNPTAVSANEVSVTELFPR